MVEFNKMDSKPDVGDDTVMMVVPFGAVYVTANLKCADDISQYLLGQVNLPTEIRSVAMGMATAADKLRAKIPEDKCYMRPVFNMGYKKRSAERDGTGFSKGWFGHPCICLAFSAEQAGTLRDYIIGLNERSDVPPAIYSFAEQLGNNANFLAKFENGEFRAEKFVHDSSRDEAESDEYLSRVNVD